MKETRFHDSLQPFLPLWNGALDEDCVFGSLVLRLEVVQIALKGPVKAL